MTVKSTIGKSAILCSMFLALSSNGTDIAVGKWQRLAIDGNTPDIEAGEGLFLNGGEASVVVAADASWKLPWWNFFSFGKSEIGILGGKIRLTTDSKRFDFAANPPSELSKAALWLDASKNVKTAEVDSKACIIDWGDAREKSATPSEYGYAASADQGAGNGPELTAVDGFPCVNFKGYSGTSVARSFQYKSSNGSATSYAVRHAFFVQHVDFGVNMNTAPVLGNMSNPYFYTYPTTETHSMLAANGAANPLAYSCEYLVDGVYGDPTANVSSGVHLHEFTLPPNRTIQVDSLVNDRNIASGGHRIHEISLFTEPLSVLERMRITAYLKAKWSCKDVSSLSLRTASGSVVELNEGISSDSIEISGDGKIVVGADAVYEANYLYADTGKDKVSYALADETAVLSMQAAEFEYSLLPCDRVTVEDLPVVSKLTKDTLGEKGSASVESARKFIVSKLDSGITNLTVSGGGDLVLRAPSVSEMKYTEGKALNADFVATSLSVPENKSCAETALKVPSDGDWEVEFRISNTLSGTTSDGTKAAYRIQLKSEGLVVWERIVTAVAPSAYGNAPQSRRYLIRNLSAGDYSFCVTGVAANSFAANLTDLSLVRILESNTETVIPVTDGDFENSYFVRTFFATRDNNSGGKTQWTLTNGALSVNPAVQTIVSSSMGYSGNYDYMFRSPQLGRYGDNSLLWYHNNSTATSPATVLPKGVYRLRLEAVRWMTGTTEHGNVEKEVPGSKMSRCNNGAVVTASVQVNGGELVPIGEIGPISNFTLSSFTFPACFAAEEGDSVVVVLNQTIGGAAVQLDNFEFVKEEAMPSPFLGEELVFHGGFESGASAVWSRDDYTDSYRHVGEFISPIASAFGTTYCEGSGVARSAQGGRMYQTIDFPAGMFKLSWWSRARVENGTVREVSRTKVSFWLSAEGSSVTNEIAEGGLSWCTNFVQYSAYFNVPEAGRYVLGFNSEDRQNTDVLVDCVSVRQVLGETSLPDISDCAKIEVADGGKLCLDYNGCLTLAKARIGGVSLSGEISSARYPDLVSGPGVVFVQPKGLVLTVR